eukprot:1154398-Rhodomonas_salina.3
MTELIFYQHVRMEVQRNIPYYHWFCRKGIWARAMTHVARTGAAVVRCTARINTPTAPPSSRARLACPRLHREPIRTDAIPRLVATRWCYLPSNARCTDIVAAPKIDRTHSAVPTIAREEANGTRPAARVILPMQQHRPPQELRTIAQFGLLEDSDVSCVDGCVKEYIGF